MLVNTNQLLGSAAALGFKNTASMWTPYLHSPRPRLIIRRRRLGAGRCVGRRDAILRAAAAVLLLLFVMHGCLLLGLLHYLMNQVQLLFR